MAKAKLKGFVDLKRDIIDKGLCTSCGTCKGICPQGVIGLAGDEFEPESIGECKACGLCYTICPGKDIPLPAMEKMLYGRQRDETNEYEYWFGIYQNCIASYAINEEWRRNGASGGMATALAICALQEKVVDGIIVAGMSKEQPWRTKPYLATTVDEILEAQESKYAVVPMNAVLDELDKRPEIKKIGIVGLPCQVHAIRKMALYHKPVKILRKIKFVLGLLCGAEFYFRGTEHLIKEWCGIPNLEDVTKLNYRLGSWPGSFTVETKDGKICQFPQKEYKYHHIIPFYQRDRCMMCLDYAADLADISIGDIWKMAKAGEDGWNAALVRTPIGQELIDLAVRKNYLHVDPLDVEMMVTGTIGLEMKKHGNFTRFADRIKHGYPVPEFGYLPTAHLHPFVGRKPTHSD